MKDKLLQEIKSKNKEKQIGKWQGIVEESECETIVRQKNTCLHMFLNDPCTISFILKSAAQLQHASCQLSGFPRVITWEAKMGFTRTQFPLVGNQNSGKYDLFTVGQAVMHESGFIGFSKTLTKILQIHNTRSNCCTMPQQHPNIGMMVGT